MSGSPKKFEPGPIPKPEEPKTHPGGHCECTKKTRRVVRIVMGYGHCGYCGKLTRERIKVRA